MSRSLADPKLGATVALHADALRLELAPAAGGAIARFFSSIDGYRHDWLRAATDAAIAASEPSGMASYPLLPFCNRLRHGQAFFDGQQITLPPNPLGSKHALHGSGWLHPWLLTDHDAQSARLEMTHPGAGAAWPWPYPFHATQLFTLRPDRLTVTVEVENRGTLPMPLGIGHHPYLPHRASARLTVDVQAMWGADAESMPTTLQTPPLLAQLRAGTALSGLVQDNNFIDWNRLARVHWPATAERPRASSLLLTAEAPLDYLVLYSPAQHDFFCIEPVSNCTDWLNLAQAGIPQRQIGGSVIGPGQRCRGTFWLEPTLE